MTQSHFTADRLKNLVCHKSDEDYDGCFKDVFQKWIAQALDGIPELNIPSIDPLEIESFNFERLINEELRIAGILRNIVAYGAAETILEGFKYGGAQRLILK